MQFTSFGNAFTVYDTENQSGSLTDFTFRRYSPVQGRWISPDPAGLAAVNPANPQTWNRYAYVANNPLSYVDPLGMNLQGPGGGGCDPNEHDCGSSGGSPSDPGGGDTGYYFYGMGISAGTAAWLLSSGGYTVEGAGPGSSVSMNGQVWAFVAWGGTSATILYGGASLGGSATDWGDWIDFGGASISGSVTTTIPGSGSITGIAPANNQTTQKQPWPSKDPSSCSVYGSGNLLNFVCKNAGTTPYANSARGCLQSYWDSGTGTYSMTQGGPGVPWKPIDQAQSVVSFANSHAICLVGAMFY